MSSQRKTGVNKKLSIPSQSFSFTACCPRDQEFKQNWSIFFFHTPFQNTIASLMINTWPLPALNLSSLGTIVCWSLMPAQFMFFLLQPFPVPNTYCFLVTPVCLFLFSLHLFFKKRIACETLFAYLLPYSSHLSYNICNWSVCG